MKGSLPVNMDLSGLIIPHLCRNLPCMLLELTGKEVTDYSSIHYLLKIFNRLNCCFMKKLCSLCCLVMLVQIVIAQVPSSPDQGSGDKPKEKKQKKPIMGLGIKGGLNFANVTNASSVNSSSRTGFAVGVFFSPPSKSIISSRTELLFSRQGYNFQSGTKTGS